MAPGYLATFTKGGAGDAFGNDLGFRLPVGALVDAVNTGVFTVGLTTGDVTVHYLFAIATRLREQHRGVPRCDGRAYHHDDKKRPYRRQWGHGHAPGKQSGPQ
jgi:hypothetical protein